MNTLMDIYQSGWVLRSAQHGCVGVRGTSLDLVPREMRSCASRLSREETELENLRARAKTHSSWRAQRLPQFWSEVFLVVQLANVTRVRELERRAGEAEGPARRNDATSGEGSRRQHRSEGIFPLSNLQELPAWSSGGLTLGQRRRLLRALNWMHGEENRPTALPPSLVASEGQESMSSCRRAAVCHPSSAMSWVEADSAIDEHEALAKLLQGTHRLRAWCLVQRRLLRVLAGQAS